MKQLYITILVVASLIAAISCQKEVHLSVLDFQTSYEFEPNGGTEFASIDASETFKAVSNQDWCFVQAYNHKNNNLRITVYKNELAQDRSATITLTAEGVGPATITISQRAAEPFVVVSNKSVSLDANITKFSLDINCNTLFDVTLPSWINNDGDNIPSIGENIFHFIAQKLVVGERSGNIVITSREYPSLKQTVSVRQVNHVLPIIDDNFDWAKIAEGAVTTVGSTANEVKITNLTSTNGWTSNERCWARGGYFRLGQTSYAGTLTSPSFASLTEATDVNVSFKAARWVSSSNALDYFHEFTIEIVGSGTPSQKSFTIDNYSGSNPNAALWQDDPAATYTFTITGANADTQVKFIGGPSETLPATAGGATKIGRMLIDDFRVSLK
jgi:hypothetical protein